jgi:hypothetical protein
MRQGSYQKATSRAACALPPNSERPKISMPPEALSVGTR